MYKLDNWVFSRLAEPFPEDQIHWRVGGGNTMLAYIDARQVVDRLNYVVGAGNWHDEYAPVTVVDTEVRDVTDTDALKKRLKEQGTSFDGIFWKDFKTNEYGKLIDKSYAEFEYNNITYGGIRCSLSVLGVTKQDVGTPSMADQIKGAHSDALKRAAVKFGIGAYIYDLKNLKGGFAERGRVVEAPQLPDWALPLDRPDPDEVIIETIEKARTTEGINTIELENVVKTVYTMGSFDKSAALVTKRHVYERVSELIEEAGNE